MFTQESRKCNWETFPGREKFLQEASRHAYDKVLERRRQEIRMKYGQEPPDFIIQTICNEYQIYRVNGGYVAYEKALDIWRQNRHRIPTKAVYGPIWMHLVVGTSKQQRSVCVVQRQNGIDA